MGRWTERVFLFVSVVGIVAVAIAHVASYRLTWQRGWLLRDTQLHVVFLRQSPPELAFLLPGPPWDGVDVEYIPSTKRRLFLEFRDGEFFSQCSFHDAISWLPKDDLHVAGIWVNAQTQSIGDYLAVYADIWIFAIPFACVGLIPMLRTVRRARNWRRWRACGCCESCGYSLTGNDSGVCPECGDEFAQLSGR